MKFSGKVGNGPMNNWLNFGGDPVTDPDTDSDSVSDSDPYFDTSKTCLGGGMHCPSASIYFFSNIEKPWPRRSRFDPHCKQS